MLSLTKPFKWHPACYYYRLLLTQLFFTYFNDAFFNEKNTLFKKFSRSPCPSLGPEDTSSPVGF